MKYGKWALGLGLASATCGGGSAPNTPAPVVVSSPSPTMTGSQLQTHGSLGVLLPGEEERYSATVPGLGDVSRAVAWESLTPDVISVTGGLVRALAPGIGTMRATHGDLVRVDTILVASVTPPPPAGGSSGDGVVIAEFRTSGPGGPRDEFVEILNASASPVDLSGWSVAWSDTSGRAGTLGNFFPGARLAPGQRFLLIDVMCPGCFTGPGLETQDYRFRGDLPESGGLALVDAHGALVDQVAFGTPSRYREGTPVGTVRRGDQSYVRHGDTGDNAADFSVAAPTPEGSACKVDGRCP